jgi:hypothetical protein
MYASSAQHNAFNFQSVIQPVFAFSMSSSFFLSLVSSLFCPTNYTEQETSPFPMNLSTECRYSPSHQHSNLVSQIGASSQRCRLRQFFKGQGCLLSHIVYPNSFFCFKKNYDQSLYSHWLVKFTFFCIIQLAEGIHAPSSFQIIMNMHLLFLDNNICTSPVQRNRCSQGESAWLKPSSVKLDGMI